MVPEQILLMENITKVYPNGFVANKSITFGCDKGEIHALLGENGAGKTTLMKILFGFEAPTEGEIYVRGEKMRFKGALDAISHGVGMVHQHFMLVDELSVAENIVLGDEPTKAILYDKNKAIELTKELSKKYNLKVDPTAMVGDVTVATKQKIEILKALMRGAEILVLDEPTAVLTPQETEELFVELKNLRKLGHTIIFISHKLNEVKELCDRFTVLRQGRVIGSGDVADYTPQMLSNMMVGRDVVLTVEKDPATPTEDIMKVEGLSYTNSHGKTLLDNVSFKLRKGAILGIAGVEGNGQNELCEILTGLRDYMRGSVTVKGEEIRGKSVRQLRNLGVANISEDRMTYGCSPLSTVAENIISDRYFKKGYSGKVMLRKKEINRQVEEYIKEFQIECIGPESFVRELSGGNIQKVIVAREFTSGADIIVANQPTRGIDVGATEFIRKKLVELTRKNNLSVLLVSADLNEVIEVSDSLLVMSSGKIVAYFEDSSKLTEEELGEYMLGLREMSAEEIGRVMQ